MVGGTMRGESSPAGILSTLLTSAPMSASSIEQAGPAMMCERSITLRPFSGPFFVPPAALTISHPFSMRFDGFSRFFRAGGWGRPWGTPHPFSASAHYMGLLVAVLTRPRQTTVLWQRALGRWRACLARDLVFEPVRG